MARVSRMWALAGTIGAIGAAVAARKAMARGWRQYDGEPPQNPEMPGVTWKQALLWGGLTGTVAGMARVFGRRAAHRAVERARQTRPHPPRAGLPGSEREVAGRG